MHSRLFLFLPASNRLCKTPLIRNPAKTNKQKERETVSRSVGSQEPGSACDRPLLYGLDLMYTMPMKHTEVASPCGIEELQ